MNYLLWHGLAASARRYPERPAVVWRDNTLTYRELDEQSTALAATLHARGVGPGTRVGLLMPKTHRSVVAMLAISKAGAAYVPVDPAAPAPRAAFILKDCAISALVTTARKLGEMSELIADIPELRTVLLVDDGDAPSDRGDVVTWQSATSTRLPLPVSGTIESDPAYLLYTSGSTGQPKGVVLSHRHALTFIEWGAQTFSVTHEDIFSNHAPLHFDLSVFDIYVALQRGACVKIVPDQVAPFPRELARWIDAERISIWYSVPSALIRLLMQGQPEQYEYRALRVANFAGEVFPVKYLRQMMALWKNARFYNLYGPTETNVCTWYAVPERLADDVNEIPIGAACANTEVFAITDSGRRAQAGEEGELYVRGPALLLGYWRRPDKTAEMLVPNPLDPAYPEAAYRTGDIVRLDADGMYWFTGRRDHMVKSRGYRIELGEIEQALYQHASVKEAVIVAVPDEEIGSRLHAFVVSDDAAVDQKELQAFCTARVPRYMVPETFHFEAELPKTSTGKIDRVTLAHRLTGNS